uniref:Small ribosomal subunit protein uS4c n=1 Tax=Plagiochila adianthoides TaxID=53019 RepID=RR4_PLAAD|nr:RecName: Full=Small ribosomal subunit protein uS4c; AltName: Full=30S ribosomal protein S4, chloroplastic [Plagiochila adianthoides]CAC12828.1 small ribosomal protein 4 [Plagiochila adianthoides]
MSRYRGPRVKIIRRLGALPGLTSKTLKSKSNYIDRSTPNKKVSQYRIRLEEKQKLRSHYGLAERQLLKYMRIARKAKGSTGQILLQLLEMRLDNTIFRLGMSPTIPGARQLVNHRHISINNDVVDIPSYNCEPGDIITIGNKQKSRFIITKNINSFQRLKIPSHLIFDSTQLRGSVNQMINREWINLKINELLVVEYYSRQV